MADLGHIRWLGGGTGAGKTTIARRLAEQADVGLYSTDATMVTHGRAMLAIDAPLLDAFKRMSMDERWVSREPAEMCRTFPWFHGEGFELLIQDLLALPADRITLVEGFRLLPCLVRPLLDDLKCAVWLLPTPTFRKTAFASRCADAAFWNKTSDPDRARRNLLARDVLFADQIAAAAARDGLTTFTVDDTQDVEGTTAVIRDQFGL